MIHHSVAWIGIGLVGLGGLPFRPGDRPELSPPVPIVRVAVKPNQWSNLVANPAPILAHQESGNALLIEAPSAVAPTTTAIPRRRWILLGLGGIGLGGIGLLLWAWRGRSSRSPNGEPSVPTNPPADPAPDPWTGSKSAVTDIASQPAAALGESSETLTATTRLVPINVVDDMINDLNSSDAAQRHRVIWELGQQGNSKAVQPLVNAMLDADSQERSLILAALSEIGVHSLKPMTRALALSLQDQSPDVRKNAIRDLTRVYEVMGQVSHMLKHASQDSDPEVKATAQWALEQLSRITPNIGMLPQSAPPPDSESPSHWDSSPG